MTEPPSSMPPAADLDTAWAGMRWRVQPGRFSLIGLDRAPQAQDLSLLQAPCQLTFEGGELSLLVPSSSAAAACADQPTARREDGLVWIRFEMAMEWTVVGFLARVTTALAAAGIPLGAVCGFSRDHLFVAERHLDRCCQVLRRLFPQSD